MAEATTGVNQEAGRIKQDFTVCLFGLVQKTKLS